MDDLISAVHLALEHERLQAQGLAHLAELRGSGNQIVKAGDDERCRLERTCTTVHSSDLLASPWV